MVSLKIAKKHIDTSEMKDRIVTEALDELLLYFAAHSRSISFPEMTMGTILVLRKFKKATKSSTYRSLVQSFLDHLDSNGELITAKRVLVKHKMHTANLIKISQQMDQILGKERTPIEFQKYKILKRRHEKQKMKSSNLLGLSQSENQRSASKSNNVNKNQGFSKNQKRNKRANSKSKK